MSLCIETYEELLEQRNHYKAIADRVVKLQTQRVISDLFSRYNLDELHRAKAYELHHIQKELEEAAGKYITMIDIQQQHPLGHLIRGELYVLRPDDSRIIH